MIVLPFPPSTNAYWRSVPMGGSCRAILSQAGREYKRIAELALSAQRIGIITGPVAVTFTVYFPNLRGDLDNRLKPAGDVLQGFAYEDDKQIVELHAYRRTDKANPRVEVYVKENLSEPPGRG